MMLRPGQPFRAVLLSMGLIGVAACAHVPEMPPGGVPGHPEDFMARLEAEEGAIRTVRALASLSYEGPAGNGSATQAVVAALPDRARLETLSPFGTALLLLTIRGDALTVFAPARHEYGTGRATPETLGRLARIPIPPGPLLRLLVGLPPLPVRSDDPRVALAVETSAFRVESVDGAYWQRVWSGPDGLTPVRGELGEAGTLLLKFEFGDRRPIGDISFPYSVSLDEMGAGAHVALRYRTVRLNDPVEPDLFTLPPPTDGKTRIIDLGAGQ